MSVRNVEDIRRLVTFCLAGTDNEPLAALEAAERLQKIYGTPEKPETFTEYNLARMQKEVNGWARTNFGETPSYRCLLGAMEELGELSHAHLKHEQGIRGMDAQKARLAKIDAIGDIIIYLADYCNREGLDIEACVFYTWLAVKNRNWGNNPLTGVQDGDSTKGS